mmetsp:Transcript_74039/g.176262  ORF Transcript_74039/g.176262 Transcript_74039/m.176262 type:complete len:206 (+) Transcript_74039:2612-3229(+)
MMLSWSCLCRFSAKSTNVRTTTCSSSAIESDMSIITNTSMPKSLGVCSSFCFDIPFFSTGCSSAFKSAHAIKPSFSTYTASIVVRMRQFCPSTRCACSNGCAELLGRPLFSLGYSSFVTLLATSWITGRSRRSASSSPCLSFLFCCSRKDDSFSAPWAAAQPPSCAASLASGSLAIASSMASLSCLALTSFFSTSSTFFWYTFLG